MTPDELTEYEHAAQVAARLIAPAGIGTRVEYDGSGPLPLPCAYWQDVRDGAWYGITPNGLFSGLARHQVVEHPDRTISVQPSILTRGRDEHGQILTWHGYLLNGVWCAC